MSAVNGKMGFQFPKGPKVKLTADEAKKRHEENLAAMDREMAELKKLIDDLEDVVEEKKAA